MKRIRISEKELFNNKKLNNRFNSLIKMVLKDHNYKQKVIFNPFYDDDENAKIAFTSGKMLALNFANFIAKSIVNPEWKIRSYEGLIGHELGHCLYTDFKILELSQFLAEQGIFYPNNKVYESEGNSGKFIKLLQDKPYARQILKKWIAKLGNCTEDRFVETKMSEEYEGSLKDGILMNEKKLLFTFPSLKQMKKNEEQFSAFMIIVNLVLAAARTGKYNDDEINDEYSKFMRDNLSLINAAASEEDAKERAVLVNKIIINAYPFFLKEIEEIEGNSSEENDSSEENNEESSDSSSEESKSKDDEKSDDSEGDSSEDSKDDSSGKGLKSEEDDEKSTDSEGKSTDEGKGDSENPSPTGSEDTKEDSSDSGEDSNDDSSEGSDDSGKSSEGSSDNSDDSSGNGSKDDKESKEGEPTDSSEKNKSESGKSSDGTSSEGSETSSSSADGSSKPIKEGDLTEEQRERLKKTLANLDDSEISEGEIPEGFEETTADAGIKKLLKEIKDDMSEKAEEAEIRKSLNEEIKEKNLSVMHDSVSKRVIRLEPNEDSKLLYEMMSSKVKRISKDMQKSLAELFQDPEGGVEDGLLLGRNLSIGNLYRHDGKIFEKRTLPDDNELAVAILVDCSSSMTRSNRIKQSIFAAECLYDFCNSVDIPVCVYGHNVRNYGTVHLYSAVEFDSKSSFNPERITALEACGNNRDGAAMRFVANKLKKRDEAKKLFFIISDGQPADGYGGYYGQPAIEDMKKAVMEFKKAGIVTVAAAIGDDKETIEDIYGKCYLNISDLKKLPNKLLAIVKDLMK